MDDQVKSNQDSFMKTFFPKEHERKSQGLCPICGEPVDISKIKNDPVSQKEFEISGMCQKCQDEIFNVLPEGD